MKTVALVAMLFFLQAGLGEWYREYDLSATS